MGFGDQLSDTHTHTDISIVHVCWSPCLLCSSNWVLADCHVLLAGGNWEPNQLTSNPHWKIV